MEKPQLQVPVDWPGSSVVILAHEDVPDQVSIHIDVRSDNRAELIAALRAFLTGVAEGCKSNKDIQLQSFCTACVHTLDTSLLVSIEDVPDQRSNPN